METDLIPSASQRRCPIRTTLQLIGGKWKLLLIYQLSNEPLRFAELKKRIVDISEKMLAQELKQLQQDLLILKNEQEQTYQISPQGRLVLPLLASMRDFAQQYLEFSQTPLKDDNPRDF